MTPEPLTALSLVVPHTGGSDVLTVEDREVPPPGDGQVRVQVAAAGVNFIEVYQREGIYPMQTPFVLGAEGAGTIESVGAGVADLAPGDRVAWTEGPGSAAGYVDVAAEKVVPVPDGLDLEVAAAAMLQGVTAHYLVNSTYAVQPGDVVLAHAVAGGVGQLLVQLVKAKGATLIGTAGSADKVAIGTQLGADHVIDYSQLSDLSALSDQVKELAGRGVDVVYDGVGKTTFDASLASLRPRGMMVLFGAASGPVPPVDPQRLNRGGSLFLTRPTMGNYIATRDELVWRTSEILGGIADGSLRLSIGGRYPLAEAARAYDDLEGRRSTGKLLLIPESAQPGWLPSGDGEVTRRAVLGGAVLGGLAGCTGPPGTVPASPSAGGASPAASSSGPAPTTSSTTATPAGRALPLVLAVHPTRAPGMRAARAALDVAAGGRAPAWSALGSTGATLTLVRGASAGGDRPDADAVAAVQANRDALAIVRADALGPGVGALPVDGVDPVTRPGAYPVTALAPSGSPDPTAIVSTLWVGDIMLGRGVGQVIAAAGDPRLPFSQTADRLRAADLTVGNLECTLSRNGRPTQGGDSFGADATSLEGLVAAGFDVVVQANNHLGDYGDVALRETVATVRGSGMTAVGAGNTLAEAATPAVVERNGVRFGIVAFNAIGETPAATDASAGDLQLRMPPRTGPLHEADLGRVADIVRGLRDRADVVVAYPHWGTQYTHEPVPEQREVAARLVEAGATAVIGTHPHWVQGLDLTQGRLVAHSLGNFVFDMTFSEEVQQGVALELVFWGSRPMAARLLPFHIGDRHVPGWLDGGPEAQQILAGAWGASTGPFQA